MKRQMLPVLIFLLLGAIVNIAVAWGCAAFPSAHIHLGDFRVGSELEVVSEHEQSRALTSGLLILDCEVRSQLLAAGYQPLFGGYSRPHSGIRLFANQAETFGLWRREICETSLEGYIAFPHQASRLVQAGWPMPALHSEQVNIAPLGQSPHWKSIASSIEGPMLQGTDGHLIPTLLPFLPLRSGFAINTLFYAAVLWLLFTARLTLPYACRRRRIKRGLCPACAYPVGASDLYTECGHKLNITSKIARQRMGLPPPATPAFEAERNT